MKNIDIDAYVPNYDSPFAMRPRNRKERSTLERLRRVHIGGSYYAGKRVGIKPEKMLDWRTLERRLAVAESSWLEANLSFWDSLRAARTNLGLEKDQLAMIYIGDDEVIEAEDQGYTTTSAEMLISRLRKNPTSHGDFKVLKHDEGGAQIGHLLRRSNRLHRVCSVYTRAFRRSIEDRLRVFLDSDRSDTDRYGRAYTYVIENDDRAYVVYNDSTGNFTWTEGATLRMQNKPA